MIRRSVAAIVLAVAPALMLAGCAHTESRTGPPQRKPPGASTTTYEEARRQAVDIGMQPARDVGLSKHEIPPVLESALADPYNIRGLKTCAQLAAAVRTLSDALGPDYQAGGEYHENRMGKLAAAGGKSVMNSLIPYRSLVREITGAAPADRHMDAVVDAGLARRGFLRGVQYKQRCKLRP
ncbi:MAG TPA: hypothetical protein VF495_12180 [Phenylobacterium sp.]|jgi:hypothetical protein